VTARHPHNPLRRWHRRTLLAVTAALLASGLAWLPAHYLWGAGAGELPSPLEPWLMRLHGLAAMAGLFALGVVAAEHVPRGWRMGHQRASGAALVALALTLAATGYGLWYLASEAWHPAVGWLHTAAGIAATALGLVHASRARRPPRRAIPPGR
jgi:O-antigen/teichoic acid export membrane protein